MSLYGVYIILQNFQIVFVTSINPFTAKTVLKKVSGFLKALWLPPTFQLAHIPLPSLFPFLPFPYLRLEHIVGIFLFPQIFFFSTQNLPWLEHMVW